MKLKRQKKIIFLHIPKTAGTTLTTIIKRNYRENEIVQLYQPQTFHAELTAALQNDEKKMLFGHFPFHPDIATSQAYVFAFMRDPIARTVSNYFHLKSSKNPEHKKWLQNVPTFLDFLQQKQAFNWQARHLSGFKGITPFKSDLSASLEMATSNLLRLNFVGLTENFSDSLLCIGQDLGWIKLNHFNKNVHYRGDEAKELAMKYYDEIAEQNQLDLALYKIAKQRFEERKAKISLFDRAFYLAKNMV